MMISKQWLKKVMDAKVFVNFFLVFFFVSCHSPLPNSCFSPSERERYEDFFKRLLFFEQGVYTLYGSKPITEIILSPESPEERLILQEKALQRLSPHERSEILDNSFEYEEKYWFEETWSMWEEKLKTLPIHRYLFVERTVGIPAEFQKHRYIYFVNIEETAKVIQQYYPLFKEYVGFDFNPLSVVFEMKDPASPFWKAIWAREITDRNVCLIGILFGYGFDNSYPFSWHFTQSANSEQARFIESVLSRKHPITTVEEWRQFNPPKTFPLPCYMSLADPDLQKEKYLKENSKIKRIYKNSDIIDCTMQQLLR